MSPKADMVCILCIRRALVLISSFRSYADTRYIQRTEGITTTHTIQAGDVLQIQNGIITAINP